MNLNQLRKKINYSKNLENKNISKILLWLKKRKKIDKTIVEKIPLKNLKDWFSEKNGNVFHKSKQFFSIQK